MRILQYKRTSVILLGLIGVTISLGFQNCSPQSDSTTAATTTAATTTAAATTGPQATTGPHVTPTPIGAVSNPGGSSPGTAGTALSAEQAFVTQLYRGLLARDPDSAGLQYWVAGLATAGARAVAFSILQSSEGISRSSGLDNRNYVESLYEGILGRKGEDAGLSFWQGALDRGDSDRIGVGNAFLDSNEFKNNCKNAGLKY